MHRFGQLGVGFLLLSSAALADLPPPDGQRFVDYNFKVDNLGAFPDFVLLAFPYSQSNGAPTTEYARVPDGLPVSVGRRSAPPALYAMKRAEFEAWEKTYKPTHDFEDPALTELFTSNRVIACNTKLEPRFVLSTNDPQRGIVDGFRADRIDDKTCQLSPVQAAAAPAKQSGPPAANTNSDPSPTPPPVESQPQKRGCGGCAVGDRSVGGWALAALALGLFGLRRRRR